MYFPLFPLIIFLLIMIRYVGELRYFARGIGGKCFLVHDHELNQMCSCSPKNTNFFEIRVIGCYIERPGFLSKISLQINLGRSLKRFWSKKKTCWRQKSTMGKEWKCEHKLHEHMSLWMGASSG